MASVHVDGRDLDLYIRKTLDSEQASGTQLHLRQCRECRDKLAQCVFGQFAALRTGSGARDRRGSLQTLSPLLNEQVAGRMVDTSANRFGLLTDSFLQTRTREYPQRGPVLAEAL